MSRIAVDKTIGKKRGLSRDLVWKTIRELREGFTVPDLARATRQEADTIKTYIHGLTAAGYLLRHDAERFAPVKYDLVKDVGLEAPRVRRDGTPVTQGSSRDQMWRTMKILGQFTAADLAIQASLPESPVSEIDARDYCKRLAWAGYLATVSAGKPGRGGQRSTYRFVTARNTGPFAPMFQRLDAVFDPNLQRIVWQAEPRP